LRSSSNPDLENPYVFVPFGSGSGDNLFVRIPIRIRILSSTSKKWRRKTLISTILWLLYDLLSLKNDINVPSQRNKHKNFEEFFVVVGVLKVTDEKSKRISIQRHWFEGPEPVLYQNASDLKHLSRIKIYGFTFFWFCSKISWDSVSFLVY
jgi:hypothetical protein